MALWKALVYQRTLYLPVARIFSGLNSFIYVICLIVILGSVGISHALPVSGYILDSKPGIFGGVGTNLNVESGNGLIHSVEASVVSFGILISLVVFAVLCTGGCCLNIFGKRRGDDIPATGFSNPVADLGGSGTTISPIDVRALEMNPIVFEPLPTIHDLTPVSTNFYNSLHRLDSSSRQPRHLSPDSQSSNYPGIGATVAIVPTDESSVYAHDWFDEPYRNFPRGHIEYVKEVGKGWFGKLIEAEAEDIVPFTKKLRVLVKVLREDATGTEQMRFLDESRLYRDANHGNVLKLLGHSIETLPFLLIMEHCPQGDLKSFLIANVVRAELLNTQGALVRMALDIAKGLEWMASADFIHSDLAARNCQVGSEGRVIIGDYGLATQTFRDDYYWGRHESSVAIPLRWSAPETLHCTINTIQILKVLKSSNVWTFGVVLWEICEFGKLPYYDMSDDEVISRVITDKNATLSRLTRPGLAMKDELHKIMLSCCSPNPENRPEMSTIVEQLEAIFNAMTINSATCVSSISNTPSASASGLKSSKDDFDKKWEEFGTKLNSTLRPEMVLSPSWESSTNDIGIANVGSNKKKSVSFVGMQEEELPSVQVKVGASISVQQSELPIKFKNQTTPQNASISQLNHEEKRLNNMFVASEPPKVITSSILPPSHSKAKEEMDVWKVNGDTDEENWRQRIELGEISQKVQEKSQSVQDLMVLTHVEPSELSDPDSLVIVSQGQLKKPAPPTLNSFSADLPSLGVEGKSASVSNINNLSLGKSMKEAVLNSLPSHAIDSNYSPSSSVGECKTDNTNSPARDGAENVRLSSIANSLESRKSAYSASTVKVSNDSSTSTSTVSDFNTINFGAASLEQGDSTYAFLQSGSHLFSSGSDLSNRTVVSKTVSLASKTSAQDLIDDVINNTNSEDPIGISDIFQGDVQIHSSASCVTTSRPKFLVSVPTLNPAKCMNNLFDTSSNSEASNRKGSSLLPLSRDALLDSASSEPYSKCSTSQQEQLNAASSAMQQRFSPSRFSVTSTPSGVINGSGHESPSSLTTSDSNNTPHTLSQGFAVNVITPTPINMDTSTIGSTSNGGAKLISHIDKTEVKIEQVLPAQVLNQKVNFILPENDPSMNENESEGIAKSKKVNPRLRKTSTPNASLGFENSFSSDSDFFQRSDDIFEDFSMELSTQLSPIQKPQGVAPSTLLSNASINYNDFHVVMGASEDLGLKPYQRVTTQIERELSCSNQETDSDYEPTPENYDPSLLKTADTNNSAAHSSDMWLCTDEHQQQQARSKSGFHDIFGSGRPRMDTPAFQGTYTPEVSSVESSKPAVARKLLFQSDTSTWGSTNSTGKIIDTENSPNLFSSNADQNQKNLDTWDTFNSMQATVNTSLSLISTSSQDSVTEKCVTVMKKPAVGPSASEKIKIEVEESYTEPTNHVRPEFKLRQEGDDSTANVELTEEEKVGKDKFVEDIESAVEEFGSLVLADLEEEDPKVEVIKETREEDEFGGKGMNSNVIRVTKHAFSDIPIEPVITVSSEVDTLNMSSVAGLGDQSEVTEVSFLTSNVSDFEQSSEVKSSVTNLDESDNGEEDENDDESICREFVPSTWNQNLAPVKPAIKSPEQQKVKGTSVTTPSNNSSFEKSGLKKSVSFERIRKKTQLVYEYPPPPPASDSDDEEKQAKTIGTGGGHLSLALDWELQPEELENTDAHQDDWEDEFTQSRTDNPMDMYRFSGFENFHVRPSAEPFEFPRVNAAPMSSVQSKLSTPSLTNLYLPSMSMIGSTGIPATSPSTLGELRHTRSRLKLDLSKGEASLLDSERVPGDSTKLELATSKPQHVDSGVGSSTNVSPFTQCDNTN